MRELNPDARLLIIDDCVANVSLLRNILNRLGFTRIETVTDARESFARIEAFGPDLIILDLNMPHLDGFEVMAQLAKTISRDTFLPILVLTADATSQTKRKALAAGATDFLTKPFNSSELFMRIRNVLQIRFLQLELRAQNETLEVKVLERTRELAAAQRQVVAQERLHAFGEMAGGIVHDFNNALMSVIGYSDILLHDDQMLNDRETAREFLKIMNTAGKDASQVISRLRDFYRPRETTDIFAQVDLNEILQQAAALTQPKWKGQALADGRTIQIDFDLAKLPAVSGNAAELREVATNLIFNAVDAMPSGGRITLRSGSEYGDAVIEICDEGTGMSDEVRTRCLEPFFSTKGDQGTGLGLSMVFGIIKRHEGTIEIDSAIGKGTTFRLRLPALAATAAAAGEEVRKLGRSLDVLVVDDDAVSRKVVDSYLTKDGHCVVTAADAWEAIGHVQRRNFDLLITDYAMPGMSGLQLVATVRGMHAGQRIILMTGFGLASIGPDGEPVGVDLIVRKPLSREELRDAIVSVMEK